MSADASDVLPLTEDLPVRRQLESDQDGERVRQGGCICGAVRFEVRGAPIKVGLCHCTMCRKESGSMFVTYGDWPAAQFSVDGRYKVFEGRAFCPDCGARLFHPGADEVEIMLGALDEAPSDLTPTREIWIDRRSAWEQPIPGADHYHRDAPKPT